MTRKDYVKMAAAFAGQWGKTDGQSVLADLIWEFCTIAQEDNPNFDRLRFLKACNGGGSMNRKEIMESWVGRGLYCHTWSPGDGITRYRFFTNPNDGYFGPGNGIYTALGWQEANTFATGFLLGK